ncbi:MAG TPA: hypothetical protein DCS30_06365 [Rhizobiales bacterium]|nr:hypothetical protein [Hyphomicrobiales bacterium]
MSDFREKDPHQNKGDAWFLPCGLVIAITSIGLTKGVAKLIQAVYLAVQQDLLVFREKDQ